MKTTIESEVSGKTVTAYHCRETTAEERAAHDGATRLAEFVTIKFGSSEPLVEVRRHFYIPAETVFDGIGYVEVGGPTRCD
jgi:hypothetical protein